MLKGLHIKIINLTIIINLLSMRLKGLYIMKKSDSLYNVIHNGKEVYKSSQIDWVFASFDTLVKVLNLEEKRKNKTIGIILDSAKDEVNNIIIQRLK